MRPAACGPVSSIQGERGRIMFSKAHKSWREIRTCGCVISLRPRRKADAPRETWSATISRAYADASAGIYCRSITCRCHGRVPTQFSSDRLSAALGAEVRGLSLAEVAALQAETIRSLLHQHQCCSFRSSFSTSTRRSRWASISGCWRRRIPTKYRNIGVRPYIPHLSPVVM